MSTAADKAYSGIRTLILDGSLAAGEQLKEEELADRIGVSRTPIRDALRRLESEFFVTRSDSQRSFVADQSVEDIDEIFTLRAMLEGHVAARAATVAQLREVVEDLPDGLAAGVLAGEPVMVEDGFRYLAEDGRRR